MNIDECVEDEVFFGDDNEELTQVTATTRAADDKKQVKMLETWMNQMANTSAVRSKRILKIWILIRMTHKMMLKKDQNLMKKEMNVWTALDKYPFIGLPPYNLRFGYKFVLHMIPRHL